MPNPINNTTQDNNSNIYGDMDEIITKPPSNIVKYGSITMLFLLLILCSIGFFVQYDEGITGTAYIQSTNSLKIISPQFNTTIEKIFTHKDTLLQKGDKIMIASKNNYSDTILAPLTGKIIFQRKIRQGEELEANTLLFVMIEGQNKFKIKITFSVTDAAKITLGQKVKINWPGNTKEEFGTPSCEIISLPFKDSTTQSITADALLTFTTKNINKNEQPYILPDSITAYIITKRKSLAAAFVGL